MTAVSNHGLATRRYQIPSWPQTSGYATTLHTIKVNTRINALKDKIEKCLTYSNQLEKCLRILAWLVTRIDSMRNDTCAELTMKKIEIA